MKKYKINFKNMNKLIYIVCLVACVGLFVVCKGVYHCKPKKMPANIKPIDCNNFNDVTTVYWNLYKGCDTYYDIKPPCDTLLVEGWGYRGNYEVILCPDSVSAAEHQYGGVALHWRGVGDKDIDYYYMRCTSFSFSDGCGSGMCYNITLIGDRIRPQIENE